MVTARVTAPSHPGGVSSWRDVVTTLGIVDSASSRLFDPKAQVAVVPLSRNEWLTAGVWRIADHTRSVVLKRMAPPDRRDSGHSWDAHWTAQATQPHHWNYWRREALLYESDLLGVFVESGIGTPDVVAIERSDSGIDLWLEDIRRTPASQWPLSQYADAAYCLGRTQAFFARDGLPKCDWLSRGFLRAYSGEKPFPDILLEDGNAWTSPLIASHFSMPLRHGLVRFSQNKEAIYAIAERLPRTLCHLDFWTRNLFGAHCSGTVVIDWSFTGDGAIGEDIGNLIPSAALDGFVAAESLPALEATVLPAYLAGLKAGGWTDDPRLVRLGMCASAVKYVWLGAAMLESARRPHHPVYAGYGGMDAEDRFRQTANVLEFLVRWADEACHLVDEI